MDLNCILKKKINELTRDDYMLKHINEPLSEEMIKKYHFELKNGVFEDLLNGYMVGDYKTRVNRVSDITVANPMDVAHKMSELLDSYSKMDKSIRTVALFHAEYELIHPFQDGNGRTGRMIIFKQCLDNGMIPIIIKADDKAVYSHALLKAQTESDISLLEELFIRKQAEYYDIVREFLYDYSVELNIEDKKRKDSIRKVR